MRFMLEYLEFFYEFRATFLKPQLWKELYSVAYSKFKLLHLCIPQHRTHFPNMHRKHNIVSLPSNDTKIAVYSLKGLNMWKRENPKLVFSSSSAWSNWVVSLKDSSTGGFKDGDFFSVGFISLVKLPASKKLSYPLCSIQQCLRSFGFSRKSVIGKWWLWDSLKDGSRQF